MCDDSNGPSDANKAVKLEPMNAYIIETHAEIFETLGQRDMAIADYRAALKFKPKTQSAAEGLNRLSR